MGLGCGIGGCGIGPSRRWASTAAAPTVAIVSPSVVASDLTLDGSLTVRVVCSGADTVEILNGATSWGLCTLSGGAGVLTRTLVVGDVGAASLTAVAVGAGGTTPSAAITGAIYNLAAEATINLAFLPSFVAEPAGRYVAGLENRGALAKSGGVYRAWTSQYPRSSYLNGRKAIYSGQRYFRGTHTAPIAQPSTWVAVEHSDVAGPVDSATPVLIGSEASAVTVNTLSFANAAFPRDIIGNAGTALTDEDGLPLNKTSLHTFVANGASSSLRIDGVEGAAGAAGAGAATGITLGLDGADGNPYSGSYGDVLNFDGDLTAAPTVLAKVHSYLAAKWSTASQRKVLFVGDSITLGTGDGDLLGFRRPIMAWLNSIGAWKAVGPYTTEGYHVAPNDSHSAVYGAPIQDWIDNLPAILATYSPDLVVLMTGSADAKELVPYAGALTRYAALLAAIHTAVPAAVVMVTTLIDCDRVTRPAMGANLDDFNAGLTAVWDAAAAAGITLIRWDARAAIGDWNTTTYYDDVHPSAMGFCYLAAAQQAALNAHYLAAEMAPAVAITSPGAAFTDTATRFGKLRIEGTCLRTTIVDVYTSPDGNTWTWVDAVNVLDDSATLGLAGEGGTWAVTATVAAEGALQVRAIARGPGGTTTSAIVSGTLTAATAVASIITAHGGWAIDTDRDWITAALGAQMDLDCQMAGTASWTSLSGTLSKQTGTPYQGTRVLRVTAAGAVPRATNYTWPNGTNVAFRMSAKLRGDGTMAPILGTSGAAVWTGTTSTAWQSGEAVVIGNCYLRGTVTTAGKYFELGDMRFSVASINTVVPTSRATILHTEAQTTQLYKPYMPVATINNHVVQYYNGTAMNLGGSLAAASYVGFHAAAGCGLAWVVNSAADAAGEDVIVDTCNNSASGHGVYLAIDATNAQVLFKVANGSGTWHINAASGAGTVTLGADTVVSVRFSDAAGWSIKINAAAEATGAVVGVASTTNPAAWKVGATTGLANFYKGLLGARVCVVGRPSDAEFAAIHADLRAWAGV